MSRSPRPGRVAPPGPDEQVVLRTRTHGKALIWPALGLILTGAATGAGAAAMPSWTWPFGQLAVAALGLALSIWWAVAPFLRWWNTTYTITTDRLLIRSGILTRQAVDLPLNRIVEVRSNRSLSDRMFRCGSLELHNASEHGVVKLVDIGDVERVHGELTALLFGDEVRA